MKKEKNKDGWIRINSVHAQLPYSNSTLLKLTFINNYFCKPFEILLYRTQFLSHHKSCE